MMKRCQKISPTGQNDKGIKARKAKAVHTPIVFPGDHFGSRGFTLIEILLAIFILGLVLSTVYAAYSGTLKVVQEMEQENSVYRMARTAMDRMIRDLSCIAQSGGSFEFRSGKDRVDNHEFGSLSFWSAAHLAFRENDVDGGAVLVGYFVVEEQGEKTISLRRSELADIRAAKNRTSNGGYVICRNIESLNFRFYDVSGREFDSWDSSSTTEGKKGKIPVAVQIELSLVNSQNKEKPYKFMTKVFLPMKL